MYVSKDMQLVIFFYRDHQGKPNLNYYELKEKQKSHKKSHQHTNSTPRVHDGQSHSLEVSPRRDNSSTLERMLIYKSTAKMGIFFSVHSPNYRYCLEQNDLTGLLEIHTYDRLGEEALEKINKKL